MSAYRKKVCISFILEGFYLGKVLCIAWQHAMSRGETREEERVSKRERGRERLRDRRLQRQAGVVVYCKAFLGNANESLLCVRMSGEEQGTVVARGEWQIGGSNGGDSDGSNAGVSVANAHHCSNNKLPGLNFTCLYVCWLTCMYV